MAHKWICIKRMLKSKNYTVQFNILNCLNVCIKVEYPVNWYIWKAVDNIFRFSLIPCLQTKFAHWMCILMIFSNRPEGKNFIIIYITRAIIIIIALQGNNDFTTRAIMILLSKLSPSRAIIIIIALVTNFSWNRFFLLIHAHRPITKS